MTSIVCGFLCCLYEADNSNLKFWTRQNKIFYFFCILLCAGCYKFLHFYYSLWMYKCYVIVMSCLFISTSIEQFCNGVKLFLKLSLYLMYQFLFKTFLIHKYLVERYLLFAIYKQAIMWFHCFNWKGCNFWSTIAEKSWEILLSQL